MNCCLSFFNIAGCNVAKQLNLKLIYLKDTTLGPYSTTLSQTRARRVETTSRAPWSFVCLRRIFEEFCWSGPSVHPGFTFSPPSSCAGCDDCGEIYELIPHQHSLIGETWEIIIRAWEAMISLEAGPSFTCWPYLSTSSFQVIRAIPRTLSEPPNQHTHTLRWVCVSLFF